MKRHLRRIYNKSQNEYYELLKDDLANGNKRFVVTVNPESLMLAQKDGDLERLLSDEATSLVPDGIAIIKACKTLGIAVTERITGVEIAEYLLKELNAQKKSLFLFGAKPEVINALVEKIGKEYPAIQLVGYSHGYVENRDSVFDEISDAKPDVCLVALGIPYQEKLIYKHLDRFDKGIFVGVGGSFDVLSGTKARAPKFFINNNIEWLYRIAKEPSRIKRFYNSNIKFILKVNKLKNS